MSFSSALLPLTIHTPLSAFIYYRKYAAAYRARAARILNGYGIAVNVELSREKSAGVS
jgi:hypothetical protein